jgi:hypothetical protein
MTEQEARQDIQIIRAMLEKTKRATAESGTLFIVWGVLITLALIGNYVLAHFRLHEWEWLNWTAMAVIGWIFSVVYGIRKESREPAKTYVQVAARHLYFASGALFLLVGLAFPRIGVYSYEAIVPLVSAVTGLLFFVMGGLFEWPFLKWAGAVWWAGALGMSFVAGNDRMLVFTALFIAVYLVPAFILRAKFRKDKAAK